MNRTARPGMMQTVSRFVRPERTAGPTARRRHLPEHYKPFIIVHIIHLSATIICKDRVTPVNKQRKPPAASRMTPINQSLPSPLYIAHRGLSSRYPENTLTAFLAAADAGAGMIELDVTLTRDRRLAVIHDSTVDRTTDGTGRVNVLTMAQLRRLDAGSWFADRFAGEPVPSLEQVLDAVKGKLLVNIEIKPEAFEPRAPRDAVEWQIVEMVTERQMATEVLISSFAWRVLGRVRALSSEIAVGLLSGLPADERLLYWFRRLDAFSWHPDYRVVSRSQVESLQRLGARVYPYAVKGRIDTASLLAMGVDGLIVDDPRQMSV